MRSRNKTFLFILLELNTRLILEGISMIAFIMSDFKVFHEPPLHTTTTTTTLFNYVITPLRWATGSAGCSVWCNNHIQLLRMGSDMWNHYTHTHTHTRSLTHMSWCNIHKKLRAVCTPRPWSIESIVKVRGHEQKDIQSSEEKFFFHSQLRSWVFIPLVCTEIYKTLTPANPAATKTGKGQQETGTYSQNTPIERTTKP